MVLGQVLEYTNKHVSSRFIHCDLALETIQQGNEVILPDPASTVICGTGTIQQGNRYVPDPASTVICGTGTIQQGNRCVPDGTIGTTCGPGTILDEESNMCLPEGVSVTPLEFKDTL